MPKRRVGSNPTPGTSIKSFCVKYRKPPPRCLRSGFFYNTLAELCEMLKKALRIPVEKFLRREAATGIIKRAESRVIIKRSSYAVKTKHNI